MDLSAPWRFGLRDLRRALQAGRIRPLDGVEAALWARLPAWNAYRCIDPDAGRRAEGRSGPLSGLPLSLKDVFGCSGFDTFGGSPRALPESYERPGPLVRRLLELGAPIVGKTHTVEFAFGGIGSNDHWGTPLNPRHPEAVPGGSTSGGPASLLEGSAHLAFGTDTAGSIRIPASFCGVVGFKPGPGHWSTEGIVPLSPTLDVPGVMARTADDLALAVSWIDGTEASLAPEVAPQQLRLSVLPKFLEDADADVAAAVEDAVSRLGRAGAVVYSRKIPELSASLRLFAKGTVTGTEFASYMRTHLAPWEALLQPNVRRRVEKGAQVSGAEYIRRRRRIDRLGAKARARFGFGELWLLPTTPGTAPSRRAVAAPEVYDVENLRALRNTSLANGLGLCATSLPLRTASGAPVGLMMMAPGGAELFLLEATRAVEQVLGSARDLFDPPDRTATPPD